MAVGRPSVRDPGEGPVSQGTDPAFRRTVQCRACPWKVSVVPSRDIPGGYTPALHAQLLGCQDRGTTMACHESPVDDPYACVGWLVHQIGPGNNLRLRIAAIEGRLDASELRTFGPQHPSVRAMCASALDDNR